MKPTTMSWAPGLTSLPYKVCTHSDRHEPELQLSPPLSAGKHLAFTLTRFHLELYIAVRRQVEMPRYEPSVINWYGTTT